MVGGMLAGGGLQKVLAGFQANGLGEQAARGSAPARTSRSAATTSARSSASEELAKIAGQLGISEDGRRRALAQVLPAVVDKVSPDGQLPPADELDAALGQLGDAAAPVAG